MKQALNFILSYTDDKNIKYFSYPDDILKSAKKFLVPSQSQNFYPLACSQNFLSSLHPGLFNLPALHQR